MSCGFIPQYSYNAGHILHYLVTLLNQDGNLAYVRKKEIDKRRTVRNSGANSTRDIQRPKLSATDVRPRVMSCGVSERIFKMTNENSNPSWPDLATSLWKSLTEHDAEISYEFEEMVVEVPSGVGSSADHATWKLNGLLRVRGRKLD